MAFVNVDGSELGEIGGENDPSFGLPYAIAADGNRLLVADIGKPALKAYEVVVR